ncbi:MAG TPA: HD domain-containing protein [Spirochaetota bacterium]|nr:HD domain-containing protein [Spirochaetota bacterium]
METVNIKSKKYHNIIRDAIHGNIYFDDLEKKIIDSPIFQRLRRISQLGFLKYVFPCSNHSRFEHSIGVMHLSSKVLLSLLKNQTYIITRNPLPFSANTSHPVYATARLLKPLQSKAVFTRLRVAGLLHDLGHGPFSHASESLTRNCNKKTLLSLRHVPSFLQQTLRFKVDNGKKISHEWFGLILAAELFKKLKLKKKNLLQDVLAILDKDIPLASGSVLQKYNLRPLLHDIITSEIDADRMDYLLRDSHSSGVNYGIFDLERLLSNMCFYMQNHTPRICINYSGLQSFEDYLIGRYQMYIQIYTHKTNSAMEAMLSRVCSLIKFNYPVTIKNFCGFTDDKLYELIIKAPLKNNNYRKLRQRLCDDLFKNRRPWKKIFLGSTFVRQEEKNIFNKIVKTLKNSIYQKDFLTFETTQRLTSLKPEISTRKLGLKVILKNLLHDTYMLADIFKHSYLITTFQKKIFLGRIFVNPDKLKEIKTFLKKKLKL